MDFINLKKQQNKIKDLIDSKIQRVLSHGKYILGPEVKEIEDRLSSYVGREYAIGVSNGTDALILSLMAIGIGRGDAVFLPSFTFFSTAESVSFLGATPIFVDIDEDSYNISSEHLEIMIKKVIEDKVYTPKAIIPVDLFGLPANYGEISKIAEKYNLKVIEDGAQSFGGSLGGKMCCSFGDLSTTSFFPAKPLGCYGDGGMVFTDSEEYYQKLLSLRVHGKGSTKYDNISIGMNARLDTIQAGILLAKFSIFKDEVEKRQIVAERYNKLLNGKVIVPKVESRYRSAWAQYTIRVKNRDRVVYELKKNSIPTAIYYNLPLHKQKAYLLDNDQVLPTTEKVCKEVLSLPFSPYISEDEQIEVAKIINNI
ncbi:MAG: aminotransferase DegT [Candidatus Cloacimonadota bacterium]|nr:MAG: aminotransferase DegT [Candidatus Cloacimonadota bacterium]PIE79298.1 MAG: aminotransferase DegT [Candidatus Delongbacteria bacterium]